MGGDSEGYSPSGMSSDGLEMGEGGSLVGSRDPNWEHDDINGLLRSMGGDFAPQVDGVAPPGAPPSEYADMGEGNDWEKADLDGKSRDRDKQDPDAEYALGKSKDKQWETDEPYPNALDRALNGEQANNDDPYDKETLDLLGSMGLDDQEGDGDEDDLAKNKKKAKGGEFGAVEAPEHEEDSRDKKQKKANEKDSELQEKINLLEECCKAALKEIYGAEQVKDHDPYSVDKVMALTIDHKDFKGYVLFANNLPQTEDESKIEELKTSINENMEKKGLKGGIANLIEVEVPKSDFEEWSDDLCEFTVNYEQPESKNVYSMGFLHREKVLPPYEDSEKDEKMILVDLKHIPPSTNVNFQAFIHLPKNDRYVKMIKNGRSLSLEQIERFSALDDYKHVHIPKEEKAKFFKFYVQNTVNWDIISFLKSKKKAS